MKLSRGSLLSFDKRRGKEERARFQVCDRPNPEQKKWGAAAVRSTHDLGAQHHSQLVLAVSRF